MANVAYTPKRISQEDYLAAELTSPKKHEFVDGVVYAMGGASDRHGLVAMALGRSLDSHVALGCQVFMSDMRLRIRFDKTRLYYYPDILVSCDPDDRDRLHREKPILLIEVLSPSTERVDRHEKFMAYTRLLSLQEYVLADQDIPKIEVFRRSQAWELETYLPGTRFRLDSVGLDLAVDDVYRRLDYGKPLPPPA